MAGPMMRAMNMAVKLAKAVLTGAFAEAAKLMLKLKEGGEIKKGDYRDWPLFKRFRDSEQFLMAYEQIFGHPFALPTEEVVREAEVAVEKAIAVEEAMSAGSGRSKASTRAPVMTKSKAEKK